MEKNQMSYAEWQVMRVVWANPRSSSKFIIESLSHHFDWQASTIKTLLNRLKTKGLLTMKKEKGKYYYKTTVSEQEQLLKTLVKLQSLICNTKQVDLITLLLEEGQFSKKGLEKIKQLVCDQLKTAPDTLVCDCLAGQCTCGQH